MWTSVRPWWEVEVDLGVCYVGAAVEHQLTVQNMTMLPAVRPHGYICPSYFKSNDQNPTVKPPFRPPSLDPSSDPHHRYCSPCHRIPFNSGNEG